MVLRFFPSFLCSLFIGGLFGSPGLWAPFFLPSTVAVLKQLEKCNSQTVIQCALHLYLSFTGTWPMCQKKKKTTGPSSRDHFHSHRFLCIPDSNILQKPNDNSEQSTLLWLRNPNRSHNAIVCCMQSKRYTFPFPSIPSAVYIPKFRG